MKTTRAKTVATSNDKFGQLPTAKAVGLLDPGSRGALAVLPSLG